MWEHRIWDLYDEMVRLGLIPEEGDSEYYYPAMLLRACRLLYERLNNGNLNYEMEDPADGLYHRMEKELNDFGLTIGMPNLGSAILYEDEEKLGAVLDKLVAFFEEKRDAWGFSDWDPRY